MLKNCVRVAGLIVATSCGGATQEPPASSSAGSGSAEAPPPPSPPAAASSSAPSSQEHLTLAENADFCVRLHEQMAGCAGEFIDLNIDLRSRYFPEFAKRVATPEARAAARSEGIKETLADGTGPIEPRRQRCTEYAQHGPPSPRTVVSEAERCYAMPGCTDKIECMRAILETRYKAMAQGPH